MSGPPPGPTGPPTPPQSSPNLPPTEQDDGDEFDAPEVEEADPEDEDIEDRDEFGGPEVEEVGQEDDDKGDEEGDVEDGSAPVIISPLSHALYKTAPESQSGYQPTGSKRRPRTDSAPPASEDPGPVPPVDLAEVTNPTAYYNQAMAVGAPPRDAVYRPRDENGNIDPSIEPTPDQVIAFRQSAHEKKNYRASGEDADVVEKWYERQIKKLFEVMMDAMANQNKEYLAHANTRDAFAITHAQLAAEFEAKVKLEKEVKDMAKKIKEHERTIEECDADMNRVQHKATALIKSRDEEIDEQKQKIATAETSLESTKQAMAAFQQSWETECANVRSCQASKEKLNEQLEKALRIANEREEKIRELTESAEEDKDTIAELEEKLASTEEDVKKLSETSGGNDEQLRERWERERKTVVNRDGEIKELRKTLKKTATEMRKESNQLTAENKKLKKNATKLENQIEAYKRAYKQREGGLDAGIDFVDDILTKHRDGNSGPNMTNKQVQETRTLLENHKILMDRAKNEVIPRLVTSQASLDITMAKVALKEKDYGKTLGYLQQAENRNNNQAHPDRRIQGRISYWRGRAELAGGDVLNAISAFEDALRIERRQSSHETLYDMTDLNRQIDATAEDDPVEGRPNYRIRGKQLDVIGWLNVARKKAEESTDEPE